MQLTLQDDSINLFGQRLREWAFYSIEHITVADAPTDYRVVPSNYQLFLKKNSIVQETTENCNDMSFEKYYFKNFDNCQA